MGRKGCDVSECETLLFLLAFNALYGRMCQILVRGTTGCFSNLGSDMWKH